MITKTLIENILIILAEGFWLSSHYSQFSKLKKSRDPKGLFAPTLALNAAGNVAWVAYFASNKLWIPVTTNVAMMVITLATLGYLLANKKQFLNALASIVVVAPAAAYLIIAYPDFSGWTGMVFNTLAATPWLYHVVTTKRTSGLSERALYLAFGAMFCTLTYAVMIHSIPLIAGCLQGLLYTVIIATYYYRYRHKS